MYQYQQAEKRKCEAEFGEVPKVIEILTLIRDANANVRWKSIIIPRLMTET